MPEVVCEGLFRRFRAGGSESALAERRPPAGTLNPRLEAFLARSGRPALLFRRQETEIGRQGARIRGRSRQYSSSGRHWWGWERDFTAEALRLRGGFPRGGHPCGGCHCIEGSTRRHLVDESKPLSARPPCLRDSAVNVPSDV